MLFSLKGVKVPHRKHTDGMTAVQMAAPNTVILPMSMHIGKPAKPVVKVGDHVDVGSLIAEQDGFVSSPVYASVSGKVKKIDEILLAGGTKAPAVVIESDGEMTVAPSVQAPKVDNKEEFLEALRLSGIVGLGGAGFPTYVKFNVDPERIEELIINGAECEPYITSDSITMLECTEDIETAIAAMEKYLGIKKVILGIEKNKAKAIEKMRTLEQKDDKFKVQVLKDLYPQGGEKVLIYHTTGKVVPAGKLPIDVGCIVCNSTTMAAIGKYLKTGMPLVSKCVTVDGSAVKEPKNVIVPIGTPLKDVFEFCGGFKSEPAKVIYGGPMMGIAVPDMDVPVLKNTNALLALDEKEAAPAKTTACIRCGACANHCPFSLNPAAMAKAYERNDMEALEELRVDICMECGCCSFICPAHRPLVQTHKLAKAALREAAQKAKEVK